MANNKQRCYPIIYVRGYAMTQSEIEATVATPYMGFNLGATKSDRTGREKPRSTFLNLH